MLLQLSLWMKRRTLNSKKHTVGLSIEMIDGGKEKDTFSALEYGLYYLNKIERKYYAKKRKKEAKWSAAMFYS